jgi:hypothetical protein
MTFVTKAIGVMLRMKKMVGEVQRMETNQGISHGSNTPLIAAALMVKAEQRKFHTPEIVRMESDGQVSALKLNPFGPSQKVSVDPKEVVAQGQSFEKSTEQWSLAPSRQYTSDAPPAERMLYQLKAVAQMAPILWRTTANTKLLMAYGCR